MTRFRLYPTSKQESAMLTHCQHARYVWNLAVEQLGYRHHRQPFPEQAEQGRQLTEARREFAWLAAGSTTVQQQALRDFCQAVRNWRRGSHGCPTWRRKGKHEGFRVVEGHGIRVETINGRWSTARVPLVGWVRFRRTRQVPPSAKSFRVTRDAAGRWHIAFSVIPEGVAGPGDGSVVGIDRGVTITLALSDGTVHCAPPPGDIVRLQRKLSRAKRGSNRRDQAKRNLAQQQARSRDRRKDFVEKTTTAIARGYDVIRIEDLRVKGMTRSARGTSAEPGRNVAQKASLNRGILNGGWGMFATRLEQKAPGRVERVNPAYTSQRCSVCQHVDAKSRKSQALFACTGCGHTSNADLNAAKNIAAGHAVTARGGTRSRVPVNREPQLAASRARR